MNGGYSQGGGGAKETLPSVFHCGLVIPIPKGQSKDLTNPSNYCGITILSNMSKMLEKLISKRIMELEPPPSLNAVLELARFYLN